MHPFEFYLKLGFEHIANLNGYDHILFLIALCAIYRIEQWKKILFLVLFMRDNFIAALGIYKLFIKIFKQIN